MQFEKYELGDEQINLVLKETKIDEKKDQLELVKTVTSFFPKFPMDYVSNLPSINDFQFRI